MINLITSILMISAIGLSVPQNKVHYYYYDNGNYEYIEVEKPKEKLVSYDDEEYTITLSAYELNNYVFNNLMTYVRAYLDDENQYSYGDLLYYTYNDMVYNTLPDYDNNAILVFDNVENSSIIFLYDYVIYNQNNSTNYTKNNVFIYSETGYFDYSLIINIVDTTLYTDVKQAIEADIAANSSPSYQNILVEALELLTGGLTTIAAALGTGMSAYVEGLLISGSSMSAFASVVFLMGGIALAFTLGRWLVNFIASLGNRNR